MGLKLREVAKLWLYALITLVALTACGWIYINVNEVAAQFALLVCYGVGVLVTYWSGGNPDVGWQYGAAKLWGASLLWFVVLAAVVAGATLCILFMRGTDDATSLDFPDLF